MFDFEIKNVTDVLSNGGCIRVSAMKECDIGPQRRLYVGCYLINRNSQVTFVCCNTSSSNRLCEDSFIIFTIIRIELLILAKPIKAWMEYVY